MKKILKQLGFTHDKGLLWRHTDADIIIGITENDKPSDIVKKIFITGEWYGKSSVRAELRTKKTKHYESTSTH